jgi:glycosyltransferase involved in cell wall biosynthesis
VAVVVHDVSPSGGMERVHAEWLRRAAADVDFTVVSCTLPPELRRLVRWRRVPVIRRPIALKFILFFVLASLQVARSRPGLVHTAGAIIPNRADLVSVHFCHAGQPGEEAAARTGSFVRALNAALLRHLALAAERWCYRRGRTRVLGAVSGSLQRQLAWNYPGVPAIVIPNGVDVTEFAPSQSARQSLRQQQGIGDDAVVALLVGGDWQHKGLGVAVAGLGLAQPQLSGRLELWVVGRGDRERYRRLAHRWGVADRLRFFGQRDDVQRFYQAADLLLLPSLSESFSLVALEAAASGLPVVATRVGCVEELVGASEAGLTIDRTPEAVAAALVRLALAPELRAAMGTAARARAARFSWERSANRLLEVYRALFDHQRVTRLAV